MKLHPYPEYKDSGVPWLGKVPVHWELRRAKYILRERDERWQEDKGNLLSVSQYTGVTKRRKEEGSDDPDTRAESLIGYKVAGKNDLVVNIMLAWNGSLGVSSTQGVVSPAYCVYQFQDGIPWYYHNLLRGNQYRAEIKRRSRGVVDSRLRLYSDDLYRLPFTKPSLEEQTQIARFLDWKTAQINKFIHNKRRLIELLKEQKQNIINQAVTRGLDPEVRLKPSSIEWLGDILEHWEVRKLKHIAAMKSGDNLTSDQIAETGEYPVYGGNGLRGYFNNYNKEGKHLLVGRQGALCGNVHRVEGKFWATEHAVVTDVRPGISTDWYYYMLTVMDLNQYSEAAARPGISVEKIQNLRTALPSLEEQEAIVSHIDRETATIDYTITRAQREIELMREYRTRLISDVVTGQVDVRGIEMPEVADEERLVLDEDTAETDDMIEDEAKMEIEE